MSKKQPMLDPNFIDFKGNKWCQGCIDSYNQYTKDINTATYKQTREFLLDQRHRFFVICLELSTKKESSNVKN